MLIDKDIKVRWSNASRLHYESLGFIWTSNKDYINIKTSQLPKGSAVLVEYSCDYCSIIITLKNHSYTKKKNSIIDKDACEKCMYLKTKEILMKTHGVDSVIKIKEVNDKTQSTILNKYGVNNVMKDKEVSLKSSNTRKNNHFNNNIKILYKDNNCELISTIVDYTKGIKSYLKFKCSCGETYSKRVVEYKKSPRCGNCTTNLKLDKVKKEFYKIISNSNSCELLSDLHDYIDSSTRLLFLCNCGNEFYTSYHYFNHENKRQCNNCGISSRSGENSHMWKGGVTSDNTKFRFSKEYNTWKEQVFQRDIYSCRCCEDSTGGNLQAHHVMNFSEHYDKRLAIENGISLCSKHHDFRYEGSFHHIYGTKDNDIHQLQEYFDDVRSQLGLPLIDIVEDILYKEYIFE